MLRRFDLYVMSRLVALFGFFVFVFFGIHWTSWVVGVFEGILADGQDLAAVLEYVLYLLPESIYWVLPVAAFAAAVYVTHRLIVERELTIFQGVGMGPFRLIRPYLAFGIIIVALSSLLAHELVPLSKYKLQQLKQGFSQDVTGRRILPGQFLFPVSEIVVFVGDVSSDDQLQDIFIHDTRLPGQARTYFAEIAHILRDGPASNLILHKGQAYGIEGEVPKLARLRFSNLTVDLSNLPERFSPGSVSVRNFTSWRLFRSSPDDQLLSSQAPSAIRLELIHRLSTPLYALVFPLIGASILLAGSSLRIRAAWTVLTATAAAISVYYAWQRTLSLVQTGVGDWPLLYVPAIGSLVLVLAIMARACGKPSRLLQSSWTEERA